MADPSEAVLNQRARDFLLQADEDQNRRKLEGKKKGERKELPPCPDQPTPRPNYDPWLLVLGVVTAPHKLEARDLKRRMFRKSKQLLIRFIVAQGLLCCEQRSWGDVLHVRGVEGSQTACADKTYAWYQVSSTLFPNARFIGKMDDDTYVIPERTIPLFSVAPENAYLGTFGTAKFRQDAMSLCYGDCTRCHAVKCEGKSEPVGVVGPYRFAFGAFHAVSIDVARKINSWGEHFWGFGDMAIWCVHEDVGFGYYMFTRTNATHVPVRMEDSVAVAHMANHGHELEASTVAVVHRIEPDLEVYRAREAREEYQNTHDFLAKGVPAQHHLRALRKANEWFLSSFNVSLPVRETVGCSTWLELPHL